MLKTLHLKPYKPTLIHALNEDDPDRRREFCEWYVIRSESDPNIYKTILWSDEASFKLNGRVNKHDCVFWSSDNPSFVIEEELNIPGVMVWAGICSKGVICPYFFDGTVTALSLFVWKISHGRHHFPTEQKETLDDFIQDQYMQDELNRLFGKETVDYVLKIACGNKDYLPHLPSKILLKILCCLDLKDIAHFARVCKKCKEVASSNELWFQLYCMYNRNIVTHEEVGKATKCGWKKLFKLKNLHKTSRNHVKLQKVNTLPSGKVSKKQSTVITSTTTMHKNQKYTNSNKQNSRQMIQTLKLPKNKLDFDKKGRKENFKVSQSSEQISTPKYETKLFKGNVQTSNHNNKAMTNDGKIPEYIIQQGKEIKMHKYNTNIMTQNDKTGLSLPVYKNMKKKYEIKSSGDNIH